MRCSRKQKKVLKLLLLRRIYLNSLRTKRRWWIRPINRQRKAKGDFHLLIEDLRRMDPELFFIYFRMNRQQFDNLVALVSPLLQKGLGRESICPAQMLAVCLRFFAHGGSMRSVAINFRLGVSTVCSIIHTTSVAIWKALQPTFMERPNEAEWLNIMDDFWNKWQFPLCLGAIDGKHINLKAPPMSGSTFYNYKLAHSIVLMAVADANYCFTMINVGASGRQSDGGIFSNSDIGKSIEENLLDIPTKGTLPGTDHSCHTAFVADEAFPLKTYLLRPYPGQYLSEDKQIFNYRLSRARRIVENCFGVLTARWRFLLNRVEMLPKYAETAVKAAVVLHNYVMKKSGNQQRYCPSYMIDCEGPNGICTQGHWRNELPVFTRRSGMSFGGNRGSQAAIDHRELITDYLVSSEGSVEWQLEMVRRGLTPC